MTKRDLGIDELRQDNHISVSALTDDGLIDPATSIRTLMRHKDGKILSLVMSDEFIEVGRSFEPGKDDMFEAVEKPDYTNDAIQFYNSSVSYVTTKDGSLVISTKAEKTTWTDFDGTLLKPITYTRNYTSGMVQSWNKFCFTGGVLEMSIELPGTSESGGLWPAVWLMGNLARATFDRTTMYVWPWSYDTCGEVDDLSTKQRINACDGHPGHGLNPFQGRGAPEIDIFEVMPGHNMPGHAQPVEPFMSASLQISPGLPVTANRPKNGEQLNDSQTWYDMEIGPYGDYNYGFWGQECGPVFDLSPNRIHKYMEDAISVNHLLNATHFDSQHIYRLEWQPGAGGYLSWYLDDELILNIQGRSLSERTGSLIPVEPMYLVMNTAISHRWGMPEPCPHETCGACWICYDCTNPDCQCSLPDGMKGCKNLPAEMKIDYIRLYQDPEDESHSIGCSTNSFPSKQFIQDHIDRYSNWKGMTAGQVRFYYSLVYFIQVMVFAVVIGGLLYLCRKVVNKRRQQQNRGYQVIQDHVDGAIEMTLESP